MKKIFSLVVACCLALVAIVFSSCEGKQTNSSYQFGYEFASGQTVDEATLGAFELDPQGMVVIYNEMKKTADQYSDASGIPLRINHLLFNSTISASAPFMPYSQTRI